MKRSDNPGGQQIGERGDATRQRILAAAARILTTKGYATTRLSEIADEAGLHPPGVYYYFASRQELIAEVMRVGQRRVRDHVESSVRNAPPGSNALQKISIAVKAHLEVELRLSDFATAVTRNSSQLPERVSSALRAESESYHSLWRDLLESARREGLLPAGLDIGVARMLVIGALNLTPEWWRAEDASIDVLVETAQKLVRRGLVGTTEDAAAAGCIFDSMLNS